MTTITYCKGLPTPADELNPIGFTDLEMFLTSLSDIFYQSTVETVNQLLNKEIKLNQSSWNSYIQEKYGLSKRYANGVIALILSNRGITHQLVNPAYTSLIGLVKYSRMYGLSSDVAAALAIACYRHE